MNRRVDVTTTDPITLEVVRNKVDGIANEMQSTLLRSPFQPLSKKVWVHRLVYLRQWRNAGPQTIAIPIHLATLIPIVETIARTFSLMKRNRGL
ncbi:MAG: hypothetical protein CM1200mP41_20890 [Gammaproteobacteria bacterium]|nr:MAG: hypothetical protein CM1200mP41_20890 [Gammaproteobacteria bacterium]